MTTRNLLLRAYPGTNAVQARFASREDRGSSPRDIYFGIYFDASIILHEVLHVFTGLSDADLANRLKVTVTADNTGPIDDALKAGGCG